MTDTTLTSKECHCRVCVGDHAGHGPCTLTSNESAIVDQLMHAPFATAAIRRKAAETIARLMVERDDAKADYVRVHRHYMNYRYGGSPPGTPPGRLADETPTHETKACAGCERGLPLDGYGHHYGRISNTGPLAPYYLDLTVCTALKAVLGECQHDLLKPDTTIEVIDQWKAKCNVCITFFDLPGRPSQGKEVGR